MKIVELPPHWRDRAMIISAIADPESWFSAEELAPLTRPKRRREWMLSRIAEKELRRRGASGSCVSFSHSGSYGAAAVSAQPIGIDAETLREISESAAHHFLNDEEIEAMMHCTIANRMLHFWSAKEAAWKRLGGSVPTLKKVQLRFEGQMSNGLRFDAVETFAVDDLVAALTLPTS
ncbi:MAG TPA: 4'-phosphopantetheinyl transferase superfamily protein [Thermoanaerobaculia bacterium]|nr:4'-phosphopantetheinyl transferase superfamily protein [Thermoanaerobaculia bacterium]